MLTATAEDYVRIFEAERQNEYPVVDAFEQRMGYSLDRQKLEDAARVLACPLKVNPPNWQHGRVLYAAVTRYLVARGPSGFIVLLDIGTAKGFSALCLEWALDDSGRIGQVESVDVIDPAARAQRNTVAETDGPKTLVETLSPWPEAQYVVFSQGTGIGLIQQHQRVHVAFVDGKHEGDVVLKEGKLLADRQESGDLVIFDDLQIPGVARAVSQLDPYDVERLDLGSVNRAYGIATRR